MIESQYRLNLIITIIRRQQREKGLGVLFVLICVVCIGLDIAISEAHHPHH